MSDDIKLTMLVKNLVEYSSSQTEERQVVAMNGSDNLILTGWGYVEYVAAAAAALKALGGDADVRGVSRRRLPELMEELADAREGRDASAGRPKRNRRRTAASRLPFHASRQASTASRKKRLRRLQCGRWGIISRRVAERQRSQSRGKTVDKRRLHASGYERAHGESDQPARDYRRRIYYRTDSRHSASRLRQQSS